MTRIRVQLLGQALTERTNQLPRFDKSGKNFHHKLRHGLGQPNISIRTFWYGLERRYEVTVRGPMAEDGTKLYVSSILPQMDHYQSWYNFEFEDGVLYAVPTAGLAQQLGVVKGYCVRQNPKDFWEKYFLSALGYHERIVSPSDGDAFVIVPKLPFGVNAHEIYVSEMSDLFDEAAKFKSSVADLDNKQFHARFPSTHLPDTDASEEEESVDL